MSARHAPVCRATSRGLTLIELLITMVISLVILAAITYIYLGSRGAYRSNESVARLQENGRFALDSITRDVRGAGNVGCASNGIAGGSPSSMMLTAVDNSNAPTLSVDYAANGVVGAYAGGSGFSPPSALPQPVPGSGAPGAPDVLVLRVALSPPAAMVANPNPTDTGGASITVDGAACNWRSPNGGGAAVGAQAGPHVGDYFLVSSCNQAALIRPTAVDVTGCAVTPALVIKMIYGVTGQPLTAGGAAPIFVSSYATVQEFDQVTYYIGINPTTQARSLYRLSLASGAAGQVVDNVEDMAIEFGVSTAANPTEAASYVATSAMTAANYLNVVSIRIWLVVAAGGDKSATAGAVGGAQTLAPWPFARAPYAPADGRLRDLYMTTIAMRNRIK